MSSRILPVVHHFYCLDSLTDEHGYIVIVVVLLFKDGLKKYDLHIRAMEDITRDIVVKEFRKCHVPGSHHEYTEKEEEEFAETMLAYHTNTKNEEEEEEDLADTDRYS